jgi:serine phosphatase RsbU (regulator of sigma subunit)
VGSEEDAPVSPEEEKNMALVRRYWEAHAKGDLDTLDELLASDFNGDTEELRARGMPLGLMPGMRYEEKETILRCGQAALLYSDGLVEAHDPEGDMFGFPRLRTLIAERAEEERPLGELLLEELYSFTGEGWEQEDDITLLTLKRSASLS